MFDVDHFKSRLMSSQIAIQSTSQRLHSLISAMLGAGDLGKKSLSQFREAETLYRSVRIACGNELNNSFDIIDDDKTYSREKIKIAELFNILDNGAGYLYAVLRKSDHAYLYKEYKKTMKRTSGCPPAIYIEQSFLNKMQSLCEGQSMGLEGVNICELTRDLVNSKQLLDITEDRTSETYQSYFSGWSFYRGCLIQVLMENYIKLYNTELIMCLPRFLDQQTQLKIRFRGEQLEWESKHEPPPKLDLNVY